MSDKDNEIWKDIPNYEGCYQVSNFGRIKSLERLINGRPGLKAHRKEKMLKSSLSKVGYLRVTLSDNGKTQFLCVHRWVMLAFTPNPENHPEHKPYRRK